MHHPCHLLIINSQQRPSAQPCISMHGRSVSACLLASLLVHDFDTLLWVEVRSCGAFPFTRMWNVPKAEVGLNYHKLEALQSSSCKMPVM